MPINNKCWMIILLFLLISLACSGVDDSPSTDIPTAVLPTITPSSNGSGPSQPEGLEEARVSHVIDGDTVELGDGRRVRYIGINTPERNQPYYSEASQTNRQLVEGKTVYLEFDVDTFDRYGRTLAYVWIDGAMANLEIVRLGYANAFTVPPTVRYETEFRQAEQAAREAERGLWAGSDINLRIIHIEANAPGDDRENPNGEWIEISNTGSKPVQMQGYTLKDEANHIYEFGNFEIRAGQAFRLYSGQGQNSQTELYWGLVGESIWNNGSDAAFLRDAQGALIDTFAY